MKRKPTRKQPAPVRQRDSSAKGSRRLTPENQKGDCPPSGAATETSMPLTPIVTPNNSGPSYEDWHREAIAEMFRISSQRWNTMEELGPKIWKAWYDYHVSGWRGQLTDDNEFYSLLMMLLHRPAPWPEVQTGNAPLTTIQYIVAWTWEQSKRAEAEWGQTEDEWGQAAGKRIAETCDQALEWAGEMLTRKCGSFGIERFVERLGEGKQDTNPCLPLGGSDRCSEERKTQ